MKSVLLTEDYRWSNDVDFMLEGKTRLCKEKGDLRFLSTSLDDSFYPVFKFRKYFHEILELKENIGRAIQRLEALIHRTGS